VTTNKDILNTVAGPFSRIEFVEINLNSHAQVKEFLYTQGWAPDTWNYNKETKERTSPKLTESSFHTIKGELGQLVARRNVLRHRRNTIQSYKDPENKGYLGLTRDDGRIEADGFTCATPTARYTHKNVVNVPSPPAAYGAEMRACFYVLPPYRFLGADLAAIESRILGHYTSQYDGGAYASEILDGDIHQKNADMIGCSRGTAKSFQYATMYGAGIGKLASILEVSSSKAEELISKFWDGNPALQELVKNIKGYYARNKCIKGLDGRDFFIRSEHILLNSLLQGAAAVVFKKWMVLANEELKHLDIQQIIAMHDELQFRCHEDCVEEAIPIIERTCIEAGESYNLRVPIVADCQVGQSWLDTH